MRLPGGEPTLLTDHGRPQTPSWTADSQEVVFATNWEMNTGLWRISVNGGEPQRVPLRGGDVLQPTISGNRLAYVDITGNADIWRLELTGQDVVKPAAQPLISWSSNEYNPSISPDGRRIAFASSSSGGLEIWTSGADGTNATRLTDMITTGSPDWSPDGKWIAFSSNSSGNDDVYVVSADGGPVRQLTTDASYEKGPRWSRDGRWIYFDSFRTGSWQTLKMPSDGGKAVQVTKEGGVVSRGSADGQSVYVYYGGGQGQPRKGVWRRPVSGGPETLVLDAKIEGGSKWDVTDRGIYFMESDMPTDTLCFYDFAARLVKKLGHLCDRCYQPYGPRVSPDGTWLLYSGGVYDSHIMMIDNFR
jgi:Tol biopolymer transport system component